MTIEDRIKDALRAAAGTATATPAKWERVRRRLVSLRAARRRQRLVLSGLSLAAALAIVFSLVNLGGRPVKRTVSSPGAIDTEPIVVVDQSGELQVRTLDGRTVWSFGRYDVVHGAPGLAASAKPEGGFILVDHVASSGPCAGRTREIDRAWIRNKTLDTGILEGGQPALSPDGTRAAYVTYSGADCTKNDMLVIRTIEGMFELRITTGSSDESVVHPYWSFDGTKVVAVLAAGDTEHLVEVSVDGPQEPATFAAAGHEITVPAGVRPFGYLTAREYLGLRSTRSGTEVVGFDATGQMRSLGEIPGAGEGLSAVASPDGRAVLVVRGEPGAPASARGAGSYELWEVASGAARLVASDVVSAAWL